MDHEIIELENDNIELINKTKKSWYNRLSTCFYSYPEDDKTDMYKSLESKLSDSGLTIDEMIQYYNSEHIDSDKCIYCWKEPRNVLLLPCKHLCFCHRCFYKASSFYSIDKTCPLCRDNYTEFMTIYR